MGIGPSHSVTEHLAGGPGGSENGVWHTESAQSTVAVIIIVRVSQVHPLPEDCHTFPQMHGDLCHLLSQDGHAARCPGLSAPRLDPCPQ